MKTIKLIYLILFTALLLGSESYAQNSNDLCNLDKSKMIPLRDAKYRKYQYTANLEGSAIKKSVDSNGKNIPYGIHFDTGSWTTSVPGGALNWTNVKILEKNIKDPWGKLADKVSGQFILKSEDGTQYVIDDYIFYATKKDENTYLPDDRTSVYGNGSIMGAFPSLQPGDKLPSLPYAIAKKYSPNNLGFGIVSNCLEDVQKDWNAFKSYLQIGISSDVANQLNWRTDIPNWRKSSTDFCPEATPGFKVKINFSDTKNTIETADDLIATIDTGAPDLTLRLAQNDPQNQAAFSKHFVKKGPWQRWNNKGYDDAAKTLINADVTIQFTDSKGEKNSYTYTVGNDAFTSPASMYVGTWNGDVPWKVQTPDKPKNRISIGNTIYFYCPVFYYDIKNKQVGLGFNKQEAKKNTLNAGESLLTNQRLYSSNGVYYLAMQADGNLCIYKTEGDKFVWCSMAHGFAGGKLVMQTDGNLVVYTGNEAKWNSETHPYYNAKFRDTNNKPVKLVLENDGKLNLYTAAGKVIWTNK